MTPMWPKPTLAAAPAYVVICIWTAPSCDSLQQSLYGTAMPGAGAIHHITSKLMQCSKCFFS